jgi:formylglycine-generating enzyme
MISIYLSSSSSHALITHDKSDEEIYLGTELTYAGSNNVDEVTWYWKNAGRKTHPVGQKKANAWGLYDCSGNVLEWCNDERDSDAYKNRSSTIEDPSVYGSAMASRSIRGGSWYFVAASCRVAYRFYDAPDFRSLYLGFRFLRKVDA